MSVYQIYDNSVQINEIKKFEKNLKKLLTFWFKYGILIKSLTDSDKKCDSGVVGNARPCQGRDRGFEPRLSLSKARAFENFINAIVA